MPILSLLECWISSYDFCTKSKLFKYKLTKAIAYNSRKDMHDVRLEIVLKGFNRPGPIQV